VLFQPADLSLRVSDEIQGNILAGFNKDFQEFILLRFDDIGQGQRWCAALCRLGIATTRQVATFNAEFSRQRQARDGQDPPDLTAEWINVAFTFAGVDLLAPALDLAHSDRMRQVFPAFRDGPAKRADRLGDIDESGPEGWTFGNDRPTIHAIVTVAADREPDLARTLAKLKEEVGADWEAAVHCEHGRADEMKGREHFGFRDGRL
jgi:deferrochelatase/peroxidase EfeB